MSGPDPDALYKSLARQSAEAKIKWLTDLAAKLEREGWPDVTDVNGLRSLAASIRRGLEP